MVQRTFKAHLQLVCVDLIPHQRNRSGPGGAHGKEMGWVAGSDVLFFHICSVLLCESNYRWNDEPNNLLPLLLISHFWFCFQYFPSFPATSPYVTAVGGTQGPDIGVLKEVRCWEVLL